MRKLSEARLANLLGVVATGLSDAVEDSTVAAAPLDEAAGAALVALLDFSPRGSVNALSQVIGLTHSGTVRLVDRLVTAGYVARHPGPDARSLTLELTAAGHLVAHAVRTARHNVILRTIEHLSPPQQQNLTELCELLVAALTEVRLEQRMAGQQPAGGALCRLCDFAVCGRPEGACPVAQTAARLTERGDDR